MSRVPTIAILSVSAGAGHMRAAEAIKAAVQARHPGYRAVHLDVMDLVPRLFRRLYAESYLKVIDRHPALWGYLYHTADRVRPDSTLSRLRQGIERLNTRRFAKTISELSPDFVICTHFLPAQLLSRMIAKEGFAKPVAGRPQAGCSSDSASTLRSSSMTPAEKRLVSSTTWPTRRS
jgi:processive 1,2-diacylglycerol beta-glucosyltransferase